MRLRPFAHKFTYRVFTSLLDVDDLEGAARRVFSVDRFNLFSFHRRDHGPRDGGDLRPWVEAEAARAGIPQPARIMLLSIPRFLGFAFNPLSVYFLYDEADRPTGVIHEVKNTFGDQVAYALPARPDADGAIRQTQAKEMFVSPFIGMDQTYRFTIRAPDERLALRIKQGAPGEGDTLIATQTGLRAPLTDRALIGLSFTHPLAALKIVGAIHWQALRLWLKGARFHRYSLREADPVET